MTSNFNSDSEQNTNSNKPVDIQTRRLARELEQEIGGLFGIKIQDIEDAIKRFESRNGIGEPAGESVEDFSLPDTIERSLRLLDIIYEMARISADNEDLKTVNYIIEMLDNYKQRIGRLLK